MALRLKLGFLILALSLLNTSCTHGFTAVTKNIADIATSTTSTTGATTPASTTGVTTPTSTTPPAVITPPSPVVTPPTILSITPNSGSFGMSPSPVIAGANFEAGAKVFIGGVAAQVTSSGSTHLSFQPPKLTTVGFVDVEVLNPDGGSATIKNGWSYPKPSPPPSAPPPVAGGSGGSNSPNFPRLGGVFIGGPQKYDGNFQKYAAKLNMVFFGGDWEGWNPGYTKEQVISSIKSQSHVGTKVFQYCFLNGSYMPSRARYPAYANEVNAMGWWLYNHGTSGSIVAAADGNYYVNMTSNVRKDPSTGLGPYQWGAKFINDYFHLGKYQGQYKNAAPDPELDGIFLDNVFTSPDTSGDWLRNGSNESGNPTVDREMMQGEASFAQYIHSVWPSAIVIGNIGDSLGHGIDHHIDVSPLKDQFQGGIIEAAIGVSWSVDTWGGSAGLMRWYKNSMDNLAAPKMLEFNVHNMTSDGRLPGTASYQGLRYSLTAALMNDGYYSVNTGDGRYDDSPSDYLWFDEFDGAGIGEGYLGQPLSTSAGAPQTGAWQNGVWKREFDHGIVLWNPRGNGTRTVSLSGLGNLKHLCGKQERNVNNCQSVTNASVTIQNADGVILLRY